MTTHVVVHGKPGAETAAAAEVAGLDQAFLVKAAVYERGMAAGIGLKALDRARLRQQLGQSSGRAVLKERVRRRVEEALRQAEVSNGEDAAAIEEAIEAFLAVAEKGGEEAVARKVAQGDLPEPGEAGWLEYPLNPDNLPMRQVEGVPLTSKKRWLRLVHPGDTLVKLVPARPGKPGRGVRGEKIEPAKLGETPSLTRAMGSNVTLEEDRLVAACEGACEENAAGRVRVVPEVSVEAVDARTGNLPEAGVGQTSVLVRREIKAGYSVATNEDVFVGRGSGEAVVEREARVAARNLVVDGRILGKPEDSPGGAEGWPVQVQEVCAAQEIDGASAVAGVILVARDSRFARLDADESIRVDGDLIGGIAICRQALWVGGDLGTAKGGSHTRVVIPQEGGSPRRKKQRALALHQHKKTASEIQQKLAKLEEQAGRRTQAESYWAALLGGEERPPKNPVEAAVLRHFKDFSNEKKRLTHALEEVRRSLRQLQAESQEEAALGEQAQVCVKVRGHLFLDVTLETTAEVAEDQLESQISYTVEGKRFRGHTLQDLRTLLGKQARDYLQSQGTQVEERRQAIDALYEGAEHRPSGPRLAPRRFEQVFTWSTGEEKDGPVQVQTTAFVDSQNPGRLAVRTMASVRQVQERVELTVSQEGPRPVFTLGGCPGPQRWQDDRQILVRLESIAIRGVSAQAFLQGATPPETV
jgi:uncharacterized protein (DUF342 family)